MVNFWVGGVFLFHLLVVLLLLLAVLLIHAVKTLPPLMLLHHLIPLELIVAVLVKVLQVFGRLQMKTKSREREIHTWIAQLIQVHFSVIDSNTSGAIRVVPGSLTQGTRHLMQ